MSALVKQGCDLLLEATDGHGPGSLNVFLIVDRLITAEVQVRSSLMEALEAGKARVMPGQFGVWGRLAH
jgi:hypothetical protein